jgi:uncharacterized protein YeaO (DUF488 family)
MGSENPTIAADAIRLKRAYDTPAAEDGVRVLVDRLWPRGIAKGAADLDAWMAALGPSDELRTWFGHRSERWAEFAERYRGELATPLRQTLLAALHGVAGRATLTLVYGARSTHENEAVVLRDSLLRERPWPASGWDAATTLLVVMAVVAAAHHDAVATAAEVELFAAPLLTADEIAAAREALSASGQVLAVAGDWKLSAQAQAQVRQLAGRRALDSASA